ncbi:class I SAM-dependent methyltransferase [Flavimarina sp. Hel_I_48]|uniref:class I SAM-dependent methyltransferase n=1 Tax=Flavimarina sp. Hel_I_48 TaxID=1392488 RepID=UPI0004DF76C5|nr:class I SAM-dependent methyltransferase [Flavimarina sp. Hel_I_48]
MINRLKSYFQNLRKEVKDINYSQKELWATHKLQSLFSEGHFIPQTGWSMTPQAILHSLNIISLDMPETIVEFGSGATTLYIAKLLKLEGSKTTFFSVESDLAWKQKMDLQLSIHGLQDYVTLIYSPLKEVSSALVFKEQETWYDTESIGAAMKKVTKVDLVIIDGPFGGSTPYARYSAFPFLQNKATEKTIWLLDDTNRPQEIEILKEWQRQSNLKLNVYTRYSLLMHPKKFDYTPYKMQ